MKIFLQSLQGRLLAALALGFAVMGVVAVVAMGKL